ncbi:MAG TPA: hypothetical protein VH834_12665 [Solirubrobacteraceae bacterium]
MRRRHGPLLIAALALVAAVVALVVVLHNRGDDTDKKAAGGEPLAYVPAGSDDVVLDLDTREPLVALAVEDLAPRLTKNAVTSEQVHPLLGGRAVVATHAGKAWLIFATGQPAPRPSQGAAAAANDGVVVIAPSRAELAASLHGARQPSAKYARATFDKRFAGMPAGAGARVAFDPRPLLAQRAPQIANTPWARSLRDGAAVLTTSGNELHLPFRITADPVGLKPADLPIATGAAPPSARGKAPLIAGVRDPAHTLAFLRAAKVLPALDVLNELPGILRPDLNDLGPNGTVTSPALDLNRLTVRSEPAEPKIWSTRLKVIAGLAGKLGFSGADVEEHDGAYTITADGKLVGRVGVFGDVLVLSNDPTADLRAAANAPPVPTPPGAAGALTVRLNPSVLGDLIPALVRDRLSDVTGWARAELTGVNGELRLAVR